MSAAGHRTWQPDVAQLTSALVQIPSVGSEHGERELCRYLERFLRELPGAAVELHEWRPGRTNLICTLDSGRPGLTLLLNGHTDTVAAGSSGWTRPPFGGVIENGAVWGRGACDMKGGLAALAIATRELALGGGPRAGKLVLAATADEDGEAYWGLPQLVRAGLITADAAIVAEPAGLEEDFEALFLGSLGYGYAVVEVTVGNVGHSSEYDPSRPHAVAVAAALLGRIERGFRPSPVTHALYPNGPNVVAGELFTGGTRAGDLPREARFTVGARLLPGARREDYTRELEKFVQGEAVGVTIRVEEEPLPGGFVDTWAPGMDIPPDHALVVAARRWLAQAGYRAEPMGFPAFSEGAVLAAHGIPTLPALGPGQLRRYAHRPDERVNVRALDDAVALYLDLFDRFLTGGSA